MKPGRQFVKMSLGILAVDLGKLSGADFKVLFAMSKFVNGAGECWPSKARLTRDSEIVNIARSLRHLEKAGLIQTEQSRGHVNRYTLRHFTYGHKPLIRGDGLVTPPMRQGVTDSSQKGLPTRHPELEILNRRDRELDTTTPVLHHPAPLFSEGDNSKFNSGTTKVSVTKERERELDGGVDGEPDSPDPSPALLFFEGKIERLKPYTSKEIRKAVRKYGLFEVMEAMREAVDYKHLSWGYVRTILEEKAARGEMPQGDSLGGRRELS